MRITDEDKLNYGPACRDYFWLMCRLVNCLPNDIIQGKILFFKLLLFILINYNEYYNINCIVLYIINYINQQLFSVLESIKNPSKCIIDIEALAVRVWESIATRDFIETHYSGLQDDGLIGLLNLMSNILGHKPPFKFSKHSHKVLDTVCINYIYKEY